jgi:hypothetical protein
MFVGSRSRDAEFSRSLRLDPVALISIPVRRFAGSADLSCQSNLKNFHREQFTVCLAKRAVGVLDFRPPIPYNDFTPLQFSTSSPGHATPDLIL